MVRSVFGLSFALAAFSSISAPLILLPDQATKAEVFAAEELRHHLDVALGCASAVAKEGELPREGAPRFFLGDTQSAKRIGLDYGALKPEERILKGVGDDVYLLGGPDLGVTESWPSVCLHSGGTLYAVYEYLEKYLKVKWLWPGKSGEVIPRCDSLPRLNGVERRGIEPFEQRWMSGDFDRPKEDAADYDEYIHNRRLWLTRNRCGIRHRYNMGHAFTKWWDRFRQTDRDMFALLPNGTRVGLKGVDDASFGHGRTLCVSNPKVHVQCVKDWLKGDANRWQDKIGDYHEPCLNLCENDGPGCCVCPNCRAWDQRDPLFEEHPYWKTGSKLEIGPYGAGAWLASAGWGGGDGKLAGPEPPHVTDRYVKFWAAVLEEAHKVKPDAIAVSYAYSNYRKPPVETRVHPDSVVVYVPSSYFPYRDDQQRTFRENWLGWRRAGAMRMGYRPNYMNAGADMPFNDARMYAADVSFAATNGAVIIEQDSIRGQWSAQAVRNYVMMRVIRAPELSYEQMEDEFVEAFGAAKEDIREYCRLQEEPGRGIGGERWNELCHLRKNRFGNPGGDHLTFSTVVADVWTDEWFDRATKVLKRAVSKVSGIERERVIFLAKGLKEARLKRAAVAARNAGDATGEESARKNLYEFRGRIRNDGVYNRFAISLEELRAFGWTEPADWPFVTLRVNKTYDVCRDFLDEAFAAQRRHPGLVNEIWFSNAVSPYDTPTNQAAVAARGNLPARNICRELGVQFSFQQQFTLGHSADNLRHAEFPASMWAVDADGQVRTGFVCATSPEGRDFIRRKNEAVLKVLQPDAFWPDDDIRQDKAYCWKGSLCFCDRCLGLFGKRMERTFTREELVKVLLTGVSGQEAGDVRRAWTLFQSEVLAGLAEALRDARDAAAPKCRLGLQTALAAHTWDGPYVRRILETLSGKNHESVGLRPGHLYYRDAEPRKILEKFMDVARETARSSRLDFVGRMCYENEMCPHVAALKNPVGYMHECAMGLAAGCDSLSLYYTPDENEEPPVVNRRWFETLAAYRPYFQMIVDAFSGTQLGGVALYHGEGFYDTADWGERGTGWAPGRSHADACESLLLQNGVPVGVRDGLPEAYLLNRRAVATLRASDLERLLSRPLLMDYAAFKAFKARFPDSELSGAVTTVDRETWKSDPDAMRVKPYREYFGGKRATGVAGIYRTASGQVRGLSSVNRVEGDYGTCVVTLTGGVKVALVQDVDNLGAWDDTWSCYRRACVLDALDEIVPGGLSARLLTPGYAVVCVTRRQQDGSAAGAFLMNLGAGPAEDLVVELRTPSGRRRITVPRLAAYETALITEDGCFKGDELT